MEMKKENGGHWRAITVSKTDPMVAAWEQNCSSINSEANVGINLQRMGGYKISGGVTFVWWEGVAK